MFKNTAASFMVFAFDTTTNTAKTGDAANITAYVSKDYGAVTVLGDTTATEMDATNAKGYYLFAAAQAETNADCLMVSGKSSTANIAVVGAPAVIFTRPATGWLAPTTAGRTLTVDASGRALADVDTDAVTEMRSLVSGTSDSGTTTTMVDAARTEADADYWKGAFILFTSGTISGQCRLITGFTPGTDTITFAPATTQTVGTQTYEILANASVDVQQWLQTTVATPSVAGVPEVDLTHVNGAATTATLDTIKTETASIQSDTNDLQTQIGVAGAGLTAINLPDQTMNITGDITGNLSGSVGSVTGAVGSVTGAVGSVTGAVGSVTGNVGGSVASVVGLTASNLDATVSSRLASASYTAPDNTGIGIIEAAVTDPLAESYAALGAEPSLAQILYEIRALLAENGVATTTVTTKKLDGSTTAATYTINSATAPTNITRAT